MLNLGIPTILSWCVWAAWMILRIHADSKAVLAMHKDPDKHGFGTSEQDELLAGLTRAIKALTHYIAWDIEDRTGKRPPPPKPDV